MKTPVRTSLRSTAYHSVEASFGPWIRNHGGGGGEFPSATTPAPSSCFSVAV